MSSVVFLTLPLGGAKVKNAKIQIRFVCLFMHISNKTFQIEAFCLFHFFLSCKARNAAFPPNKSHSEPAHKPGIVHGHCSAFVLVFVCMCVCLYCSFCVHLNLFTESNCGEQNANLHNVYR